MNTGTRPESNRYHAVVVGIATGIVLGVTLLSSSVSLALQSPSPDTTALRNSRAQALFVRGMTEAYLEDYDQAASLFEKVLDLSPGEPAVLNALAETEAERDNLTSALYYAREARQAAPETPYYYTSLAELLREANRPEEAATAYEDLLSSFPDHVAGRRALADLHKNELGQPREALRHYSALVDSLSQPQPGDYRAMLELYQKLGDEDGIERTLKTLIRLRRNPSLYRRLLGELYSDQGRQEEAISLLETVLQETPNDPRLLTRLKMLYTGTDQQEKAKTLGTQIPSNDSSPTQLVTRARSLLDARGDHTSADTATATELLEEALEQAPNNLEALTLLGRVYVDQHRPAAAASLFERAVDKDPRSPMRWYEAASAYLEADSLHRAAALAEEGRLIFPTRYELLQIEARAQLRLGEPQTARTQFQQALSHLDTTAVSTESRAALHAGLGLAHQRLGDTEEAKIAFETALRLDARQPAVLSNYAYLLAQQPGDLDRALSLARRAVEIEKENTQYLDVLGFIYFKRGNYNAAQTTFERAISAGEPEARLFEHYGDLHRALGNDSLAQQYWKRALDRAPTRDSLKEKIDSLPQS